jgi:hypothetical protein
MTTRRKARFVPARKRMGCREARLASELTREGGGRWRVTERPFFLRIADRSLDTYRVYGCPF